MWESLSGEEHSGLWWVSSVGHSWSSSSLRSLGGGVSARPMMPRWSVDGVLTFPFLPLLLCTFLCTFFSPSILLFFLSGFSSLFFFFFFLSLPLSCHPSNLLSHPLAGPFPSLLSSLY
ncbi:hypothetical protein F4813DRAFT_156461 [Daldinia decipiens]|uniref:uncharacterized protein n=1 Tax=Daldinia decipiens TaxID=326647 RepID=UPI0020C452B7|nr:uncharacterized protein F4813DRAFT_156461 [Daldinia decipiens]KAI1655596.1 hypothetical protein F4813DRAFT_156461 [Daldinia decipiens]